MDINQPISTKTAQCFPVFFEQKIPEDILVSIFELFNPKELANCCVVSKGWKKRVNNLVGINSTGQLALMLTMQKVLMTQPLIIKAPYIMWPVIAAEHGKVVYNTIDKDKRDKKFIVYDIATKKKSEIPTPPSEFINYNFLKLAEKQIVLGNSTSLSLINLYQAHIPQQEGEKKETEAKLAVEKQLIYQTGLGRHIYHEGMQIAAGLGFKDRTIALYQQGTGKEILQIPIDAVPKYTGEYARQALNLINNAVIVAFQLCLAKGVPNSTYVDSYSLLTKKRLFRIIFKNEQVAPLHTSMVSNENNIAIGLSSGRVVLLDAIDGTFVQEILTGKAGISHLYMDDHRLIVALNDGGVSIWNPETGELIQRLNRPKKTNSDVDKFLVHQNLLVIINGKNIQFWEMVSGRMLGERKASDNIMSARFYIDKSSASLVCRVYNRNDDNESYPSDGDILIWSYTTLM